MRSLMFGALLVSGCAPSPTNEAALEPASSTPHETVGSGPAERVVVTPANPAVLGGQIAVLGQTVAIADVDGDRVLLVDAASGDLRASAPVEPSSHPFRPTVGADGTLWVSLRRAEAVVGLDPETLETRASIRTCVEPRGLAAEPDGSMWVACGDGQLVHFDAAGVRGRERTLNDLRDVVIDANTGALWVSRFRSAEVLRIEPDGSYVRRRLLPSWAFLGQFQRGVTYLPRVAWRMVAHPDGGVVVVHQRERVSPVDVRTAVTPTGETVSRGYGGTVIVDDPQIGEVPDDVIRDETCSGILHGAVTHIRDGSAPSRTTTALLSAVLPVDLAVTDDRRILVAVAGAEPGTDAPGRLLVVDDTSFDTDNPCHEPEILEPAGSDVLTSVAWDPSGRVVTLGEWPVRLYLDGEARFQSTDRPQTDPLAVKQFHRTPQFGVSCASCHPEGNEDGHTWHFLTDRSNEVLLRRTQPLGNDVLSAPQLHWDGEFETFDDLFHEAWVNRMGGESLPEEDVGAIGDYLDELAVPRSSTANPELVALGAEVFERLDCAGCHAGDRMTDDQRHGDHPPIRTPSLVGVGQRAPLMHDGCAVSLAYLFDPSCASDVHRDAPESERERNALVAYLQTL